MSKHRQQRVILGKEEVQYLLHVVSGADPAYKPIVAGAVVAKLKIMAQRWADNQRHVAKTMAPNIDKLVEDRVTATLEKYFGKMANPTGGEKNGAT